jgi:hypothetical protein
MNASSVFYLCPMCFETFEAEPASHQHQVMRIDPAQLNSELRQPASDNIGHLTSRAPRWFLAAIGTLPGHSSTRTFFNAMPA